MQQMNILDKLITEYNNMVKLSEPEAVYNEIQDIKDACKEIFVVFCLDTKNVVISRDVVTIGILDSSLVHPREIFRRAILTNSKSIILAHNHPSGDTTPSVEDIRVTKTLVEAGNLLNIKVLDHVIAGKSSFTSLKAEGFF
jgi:DNA repair protein RadC